MSGTIEYLKSLGEDMRLSEAHDTAIHYAPHILERADVRALLRELPASEFEIGTVDLVSAAISDLACQVRIAWTADGVHRDPDADGMYIIKGVATGIIDDDGVLRFTDVKVSPQSAP